MTMKTLITLSITNMALITSALYPAHDAQKIIPDPINPIALLLSNRPLPIASYSITPARPAIATIPPVETILVYGPLVAVPFHAEPEPLVRPAAAPLSTLGETKCTAVSVDEYRVNFKKKLQALHDEYKSQLNDAINTGFLTKQWEILSKILDAIEHAAMSSTTYTADIREDIAKAFEIGGTGALKNLDTEESNLVIRFITKLSKLVPAIAPYVAAITPAPSTQSAPRSMVTSGPMWQYVHVTLDEFKKSLLALYHEYQPQLHAALHTRDEWNNLSKILAAIIEVERSDARGTGIPNNIAKVFGAAGGSDAFQTLDYAGRGLVFEFIAKLVQLVPAIINYVAIPDLPIAPSSRPAKPGRAAAAAPAAPPSGEGKRTAPTAYTPEATLEMWRALYGWDTIDSEKLERALATGADVNAEETRLFAAFPASSPLSYAMSFKNSNRPAAMVDLLLRHGADPTIPDGSMLTPLHHAIMETATYSSTISTEIPRFNELILIIRTLLRHSPAIVNMLDNRGRTPVMLAVDKNQCDIVRILLDHDADIRIRSYGRDTVDHATTPDMKKLLEGYEKYQHALRELRELKVSLQRRAVDESSFAVTTPQAVVEIIKDYL